MSSTSQIFVVLPWLLGPDIHRDVNGGEAAPAPSKPGLILTLLS